MKNFTNYSSAAGNFISALLQANFPPVLAFGPAGGGRFPPGHGEALAAMNDVEDGAIPDVPMTEAYASHVYKLFRAGILAGGDVRGTFSPNSYITRQECASIVGRMAESNNRVSFTLG